MCRCLLLAALFSMPVHAAPADEALPAGAKLRLGTTHLRHGGMILAIDVTPDGTTIASAGLDRVVRLWNARTGAALVACEPSQAPASGLRFSPDGKLLAVVYPFGGFQIVDTRTGKARFTSFEKPGRGRCIAWSADGKVFASDSQNGAIHLVETTRWTDLRTLTGHQGALLGLGFSSDGKQLLSLGTDATLRRWETATGKALGQRSVVQDRYGSSRTPAMFVFAPDGKTLALGRTDGGVDLLPVEEGAPRQLKSTLPVMILSLCFSRDGRFVAGTNAHGMASVWGVTSGKELATVKQSLRHALGVALCPDGETLVLGRDSAIEFWNLEDGKPRHGDDAPAGAVRSLAFLKGGRTLVSGHESEKLYAWDVATGKSLGSLPDHCYPDVGLGVLAGDKAIRTYSFGPEPGWLDWEPGGRKEVHPTPGIRRVPYPIAPTGETIVLWEPKGSPWVFDCATGKPVRALIDGPPRQEYLTYSADGRRFSTRAADGRLRVWQVETGQPFSRLGKPPLGPHQYVPVMLSAEGRVLAQVTNEVRAWEVISGRERVRFPFAVRQVATGIFTPDGRALVLGMGSGDLIGIDLGTGKEFVTRAGHKGPVRCLCFSKDGSVLASGGNDTTTLLWDATVFRPRVMPGKPSKEELARWWDDLAVEDAARAYAAIRGLSDSPGETVPFLREKMQPNREPLAARLERLIAALDDKKFAVRERATRDLEEIGPEGEKALEAALRKSPTLEVRRRIEELLDRIRNNGAPGRLRASRVIEVLDRLSPEARATLEQQRP